MTIKNDQKLLLQDLTDTSRGIDILEFADGSSFNVKENGLTYSQTDEDETIVASDFDDIIYAEGGNDYVSGYVGDDIIYGGDGNDTIYGESRHRIYDEDVGTGNDTLIGGKGDDYLRGGKGNDIYIYNLGDGSDTINDASGQDILKFGEGISINNLNFEQIDSDLKITINNEAEILINKYFQHNKYKVESIEFHDCSTLDISNADQLIQAMNSFGANTSSTMDVLSNPTENISDMCNLTAGSDLIKKAI